MLMFDATKAHKVLKDNIPCSMKFPLELLKSYIAEKGDQYIRQKADVSAIVSNAHFSKKYPGKEEVDPRPLFVILTDEKGKLATFPPVPPGLGEGRRDKQVEDAFVGFVSYFNSKYPGKMEHLPRVPVDNRLFEHLCRWRLNEEVGRPLLPVDPGLQLPEISENI